MRDMRDTPAGNPTVTEDYDDRPAPRYTATWIGRDKLQITDHHKHQIIWDAAVDDVARNLIKAFGVTVPDNPYEYPSEVTVLHAFVVDVADDEYHSHEGGPFWNKDDAERYAEGNPGWYGAQSLARPKTIRIYGKRP